MNVGDWCHFTYTQHISGWNSEKKDNSKTMTIPHRGYGRLLRIAGSRAQVEVFIGGIREVRNPLAKTLRIAQPPVGAQIEANYA